MSMITRRRFLSVSAAMMVARPATAAPVTQWRGIAMGAEATITLAHRDARAIISRARAEIDRLEDIFSLYRANSVLSRLNAGGQLKAPPFELLECLGICGAVHRASGGVFDPTIGPLWQLYAQSYSAGHAPKRTAIDATRRLVGWSGVSYDTGAVRFARPGMALTLNGVAQGYIADKVADMLRAQGLSNILVNTGELRALGGAADGAGGAWPVSLKAGARILPDIYPLRDMALASSAPLGTVFDDDARVGHIIDPRNGRPTAAKWQLVSVAAPRAAVADALSTAGCLLGRGGLQQALRPFAKATVAALI